MVTVVNLDTGAAASRRLLPGHLDPPVGPDSITRARDIVTELAGTVGVCGFRPSWGQCALDDAVYWLPRQWRADLPAQQRLALEAEALAQQEYAPWRVYVGRGTEAPPPPEPGRELGRLCELADLLHLDLVVEARRRHDVAVWAIRYELPGGQMPLDPRAHARDLPSAVAATTFREALRGLDVRGREAPAYTVRPVRAAGVPASVDLDRLGRTVLADLAGDAPGAQAVWGDGRWWHTPLRHAGSVEKLHERDTGQIVRYVRQLVRRAVEPPDPAWWGEPVEHRPCPDCRPGTRLRRCHCRLGAPGPDPRCSRCSGAGFAPSGLTYCDHRLDAGDPTKVQGERWDIRLAARDAPIGVESPFCASVELAVARCVEYLDSHLLATVPREPERPVPAPQAAPSPPVADPTALLRRIGQHYAGQPVLVSFDRMGCRLWLAEGEHVQPLARAVTLDDAASALRLTGRE